MKSLENRNNPKAYQVTLYVRVWIEIFCTSFCISSISVTLYVRVWIEIFETS